MASPDPGASRGSGNNPAAALASIVLMMGAAEAQIKAACAGIRKFAICTSLCFLVGTAVGLCFIPFLQRHLMFVRVFQADCLSPTPGRFWPWFCGCLGRKTGCGLGATDEPGS